MSEDATGGAEHAMTAPDFAARLAQHPGPDDRPWWRLWVSAYAVPALYTAWQVGLFSTCAKRASSLKDIAAACDLSPRSARILTCLMTSAGLLSAGGAHFSAAPAAARRFGSEAPDGPWTGWLASHYDTPVTPDRLTRWVGGEAETFPRLPGDAEPEYLALDSAAWGFPAAVAADRLGLFALLARAAAPLPLSAVMGGLASAGTGALDPERLASLVTRLQAAGVLETQAGSGQLALAPAFKPFLDPASCCYKGGTLRLMELAPPSATQSWEALATERAADEALMDETIKSPDLSETYAFALHMDAQGAGADAAWACAELLDADDRVLDLAGGGGSYSICAALHLPGCRFMLLEQDPMTEVARHWMSAAGVDSNVHVVTGDMFALSGVEPVTRFAPTAVFASNIFHDWRPEDNLRLAREVFATLPAGGRFILHEMPLAEDGFSDDIAAGFSETLRVWTEGTQYKLSELQQVLAAAGFSDLHNSASLGPYRFVVGVKPAP